MFVQNKITLNSRSAYWRLYVALTGLCVKEERLTFIVVIRAVENGSSKRETSKPPAQLALVE